MARSIKVKELVNTRLASGYGGWIYCDSCGENIGYLCYVTYNRFQFSYQCNCGGCGSMHLVFEEGISMGEGSEGLVTIKNRLCCPRDNGPLFTILYKKLDSYRYQVTCAACGTQYTQG